MNRTLTAPPSIRESAICAAIMLGTFGVLMTIGFWLRHGQWVWEALV